jgi:hypothetical protein
VQEEKNRTPERESRVFIKRPVVDEMSKRQGMMTFLLLSPLCDGRVTQLHPFPVHLAHKFTTDHRRLIGQTHQHTLYIHLFAMGDLRTANGEDGIARAAQRSRKSSSPLKAHEAH